MDEVRRRVQQDTLHRRGHRDDCEKIRGLLRHGAENLSEWQIARLDAALTAGDPDYEVTVAWQCYQ
jgi:transposase